MRWATGGRQPGARCSLAVRQAFATAAIDASVHDVAVAPAAQVVARAAHGPYSTVARRRGAGTDVGRASRIAASCRIILWLCARTSADTALTKTCRPSASRKPAAGPGDIPPRKSL